LFSLVGVFAPNALTIAPEGVVLQNISVPFLDMSSVPRVTSSVFDREGKGRISSSYAWKKLITQAMVSGSILPWSTPAGCELGCNYTIIMNAPGLKCTKLSSDQIWDPAASSTPPDTSEAALDFWSDTSKSVRTSLLNVTRYHPTTALYFPSLALAYRSYDAQCPISGCSITLEHNGPVFGAACTWYNTSYEVAVEFANNTRATDIHISYNESAPLTSVSPFLESAGATLDTTTHTWLEVQNSSYLEALSSWSLIEPYVTYLTGHIDFSDGENLSNLEVNETNILMSPLFTNNGPTTENFTFTPAIENVSQGLVDLFTNVTMSLMSSSSDVDTRTTTLASTLSPRNLWHYTPSRLLTVYAAAVGTSLICAAVGMYCLHLNGIPGSTDFSEIVAAGRSKGLDDLFRDLAPEESHNLPKRVLNAELQYGLVEDTKLGTQRFGFGVVEVDTIHSITERKKSIV
jgi:hypothetical protein